MPVTDEPSPAGGTAAPSAAARALRLYINIDHVATIRQARRGDEPDPLEAALLCERAGADGITAHLREDRRHVQDDDIERLMHAVKVLNFEMAATDEMLRLAERLRPHQVTLVPERREEVTTEGGLSLADGARLREAIAHLQGAGIRTSLFIDPDAAAVERSAELGAPAVELHTGQYAHAPADPRTVTALADASRRGAALGIAVHAGHGLTVRNVGPVAAIPQIEELNIGHSVVSRAVFVGLAEAVRELKDAMIRARDGAARPHAPSGP